MTDAEQPGGSWASLDDGDARVAPSRAGAGPAGGPSRSPGARPALPTPLRPLTVGDIIDGSFKVLKRAPAALLGVTAVFVIPVQLAAAALQQSSINDLQSILSGDASTLTGTGATGASGGETLLSLLLLVLAELAPVFAGAAATLLVAGWYAGRTVATTDVWAGIRRLWLPLTGLFVIVHLIEIAGLVACILPGLVAVVFCSVAVPAMVAEGIGPIAALQRSFRLVGSRFWSASLIVLVSYLGANVLSVSLSLIPSLLALVAPDAVGWILLSVGNSLASLIITPVVATASVLLYFDLRFRGDGLDLELRSADVLAPAT